ncbi:MAG: hypothetical protein CR972_03145 [Candidatus Moraniibacteriota bacterium]|nr:MAG: hypothetical protein CR972_03145 [Candidatus Moranbacteria bacterium]
MNRNIFQKKRLYVIATVLVVISGIGFFAPRFVAKNEKIPTFAIPPQITLSKKEVVKKPKIVWPVPDIVKMKSHGCVADGLLSGYNRTSKDVKVARESNCYFFSRAIETWRDAPDFKKAQEIMDKIGRNDVIYSMFIAEAINKKENYIYYDGNRRFDFSKMCKKNSKNFWGEHTCKPSFAKEEYRAYLKQITREAMDLGIRSFLFGQIYHQEEDLDEPYAPIIVEEMRAYAKEKGIHIVIGAQTNDINNEKYLQLFDFIEGGVGLHVDGTVEDGPCFSRWHDGESGWCWALMWHEKFKTKAKNVFVHFDWSGIKGDDMSTFARMSTELRHQTLKNLHTKFVAEDVGFLMPIISPLPKDNGGCHGPKKKFYSPHMKYGCPDLDTINHILK